MIAKIVQQYYLLLTLRYVSISMIAATYAMFLLGKGLNLFEINVVNAVFFLALFLCEIPTGAFADIFGRKASFLISCAVLALSMGMYAVADTMLGFILAEIVGAIGVTFASGAFDALFVDRLRHHGFEEKLDTVFARGEQIAHGVAILTAVLGTFLAELSPQLPWIVSGVLFVITGITAHFMVEEEYFVRQTYSWSDGWIALKKTIGSSVAHARTNSNVRFIFILTLVLSLATMAPNMQWQPLFATWFPEPRQLGYVWTVMMLSMMAGAWIAPRFLRHVRSERRALLLCLYGAGLTLILAGSFGVAFASLSFYLLHEFTRGVYDPIENAYLHDNIPSKERATVASFQSISHHVGGAVGLLLSGAIAHGWSIPWAWMLLGGGLLLVALVLWKKH
jgi:MFS family permease